MVAPAIFKSVANQVSGRLFAGMQIGSDMAAGEVVLKAGDHIGAAEIGILATVGATTVK